MSQVTTTYLYAANPGETISSSNANNQYSNMQTASTTINADNTRTEAISRRHLQDLSQQPTGAHPTFHELRYKSATVATTGNYNSSSFTTLSHGGGATITFNAPLVIKAGEAIRLQADATIVGCTEGNDGGGNYARQRDQYYYAFFITVAGLDTKISPDYGYSLMSNTNSTMPGGYLDWLTSPNINYAFGDKPVRKRFVLPQKEMFSYIWLNKTGSDITVTDAKVKIKVQAPLGGCTINTIQIGQWNFVAMGVR